MGFLLLHGLCNRCMGDGLDDRNAEEPPKTCGFCNGTGWVESGDKIDITSLEDILSDIKDKVNNIKEKVDEIKEVVDNL